MGLLFESFRQAVVELLNPESVLLRRILLLLTSVRSTKVLESFQVHANPKLKGFVV